MIRVTEELESLGAPDHLNLMWLALVQQMLPLLNHYLPISLLQENKQHFVSNHSK